MKRTILILASLVFIAIADQQTVNVGTTVNDRTGDTPRVAFQKINSNFNDLYTNVASGSVVLHGATNALMPYALKLTSGSGVTLSTNGQNLVIDASASSSALTNAVYYTNIAALVSGGVTNKVAIVGGYYTEGDGGGGIFAPLNSTSSTNSGLLIASATSGWVQRRIYSGAVDVKWFGAKGDGTTDDSAALQAALNTGSVIIPGGNYITTTLYPTNGALIMGRGKSTVLRLKSGSSGYVIDTGTNQVDLANFALDGGGSASDYSVASSPGVIHGANINVDRGVHIIGVDAYNFSGYGLVFSGTGSSSPRISSATIANCIVTNNHAGAWFKASSTAEYTSFTGNTITKCYKGLWNQCANVECTGNVVKDCTYNLYVNPADGRSHSNYAGDTFNHGSIFIDSANSGSVFTGCNILGGTINLTLTNSLFNTKGVSFNGCAFELLNIWDASGGTNVIQGSMMFTAPGYTIASPSSSMRIWNNHFYDSGTYLAEQNSPFATGQWQSNKGLTNHQSAATIFNVANTNAGSGASAVVSVTASNNVGNLYAFNANLSAGAAFVPGSITIQSTKDYPIAFTTGNTPGLRGYFGNSGLWIANLSASKPVFTDSSTNLVSTGTLGLDQGGTGLTAVGAAGGRLMSDGTSFFVAHPTNCYYLYEDFDTVTSSEIGRASCRERV